MRKLLVGFIVTVLTSQIASAQDPLLLEKFPKEDVVYLEMNERLDIRIVGDSLDIKSRVKERAHYLTGNDMSLTREGIYYSSFSEIEDLKAFTEIPQGKKSKKVDVINFQVKSSTSGGVFFDDSKKMEFTYPGVTAGANTQVDYTEHIKDPRMLGVFYFNHYVPVLKAEFSVSFPADVKIAYVLLGNNTDQIKFKESKLPNGNVLYTWTAENLPKLKFEGSAPSRSYFDPHIIVHITTAKLGGKEQPILRNTADLYNWYASLVQEINPEGEKELQAIVDDIIKDKKTQREKASAIYLWVQANINYVAFEDGMGGFVPRNAIDVCNKKYGDCKDMSNLLTEMLQLGGLKAYITWIGTRSKPYTYKMVPTPMVDNHMITALILDGDTLFLDATGKYQTIDLPTDMIQGKEAMIGIDRNTFVIKEVPIIAAEKNKVIDSVHFTIAGTDLKGSGTAIWIGYPKVDAAYGYYKKDKMDDNKFATALITKGNNKFRTDKFTMSDPLNATTPLRIDYDCTIPDYVKNAAGKYYVSANFDKMLNTQPIEKDKRTYSFEFDYKIDNNLIAFIDIPEGYEVDYLPASSEYKNELFGFKVTYTKDGKSVKQSKRLYINTLMLEPSQFDAWNEFVAQLNKAHKETIVFTKKP
ncbi:hypothetical protein BH09BAC1_BH09BAC1_23820 [soil metagenome]